MPLEKGQGKGVGGDFSDMPIPCGRYHTSPHSVGTAHLCSHRNVLGLQDRVEYLSAGALEFALPPYSAPLQEPGKGGECRDNRSEFL